MPFIAYFFVLVLTAVTAVVSLDYLTAPETPVAKQEVAKASHSTTTGSAIRQVPIGKRETTAQASNDNSDKSLTPVYPAAPGKNLPGAQTAEAEAAPANAPANTNTNTANATVANPANANAAVKPPPAATAAPATKTAMNDPATTDPTKTDPAKNDAMQPAAVQASVPTPAGACAIEACASAYRSFRASDCTYQPYGGPRKMCELTSDGARQASNAPPSMQGSLRGSTGGTISRVRNDNLDDAVRAVRRLPPPSMYDDVEADDGFDGGRVVVIQRDGPRSYGGARPAYGPRYIYEAR